MDKKEIGKLLKVVRNTDKLTQKELGEKIGKSESTIRKYELGVIPIPFNVLDSMTDVLGVDLLATVLNKKKNSLGTTENELEELKKTTKELIETQKELIETQRKFIELLSK